MKTLNPVALVGMLCLAPSVADAQVTVTDWRGESVTATPGSVDSNGVEIVYHTAGEGPLVVMTHGIVGPWHDYRHQIPMLSEKYRVVVMSTRGTDMSDKPEGHEHYASARIAEDISAVIEHFGEEKAIIIGQDSGGLHAWHFVMAHPEQVERFVSLASVHPAGLIRELIDNPEQMAALEFQWGMMETPGAGENYEEVVRNAPSLDPDEPAHLAQLRKEAYARFYGESAVAFYKMNWPARPVTMETEAFGFKLGEFPPVKAPTLLIVDQDPPFFKNATLSGMWEWIDAPLTIEILPGVGHGPHRSAPEIVTPRIVGWLETGR